MQKENPLADLL